MTKEKICTKGKKQRVHPLKIVKDEHSSSSSNNANISNNYSIWVKPYTPPKEEPASTTDSAAAVPNTIPDTIPTPVSTSTTTTTVNGIPITTTSNNNNKDPNQLPSDHYAYMGLYNVKRSGSMNIHSKIIKSPI